MEQRRTHRQQHAHRAHDSPPFDMLQSAFYPTFPALLGGPSRPTQPPHPSSQYAQQHYPPDGNPPLEAQRSPPRPYGLQEHPQQAHPHLGDPASSPALQQPQPRQAAAYPLFPQDNESHNPAFQVLCPPLSRAPAHQPPQHLSIQPDTIDPCYFGAFYDNAGVQPRAGVTRLPDLTYAHHPQQRYSLPMTHPPTAIHTPPETSPTTAVPGPSQTLPEQRDNGTNADAGQRSRQWGGVGALNPATGVFSRASDHPRVRTAQACEKCRARKAKCSGDHPACQRCQARGLECTYAAERRMRGPNKPKPLLPPLPDGSQPLEAAEGQKTRRRASTMPSAPRRSSLIWGQHQQQQKYKQNQHQPEHQSIVAVAAAASPASPASSAGSGSFGYPPPSESEASPMTPHSSLGSRRPSAVGFSASPRVLIHDFSAAATTRHGVLSHVSGGGGYEDDGVATAEGMVTAGVYAQDIPPDMSFENPKGFF